MTKRAIIFDFGGVLMKTTDQRPRNTWDERLGLPHGSVERIVHGSEIWRKAQIGAISPGDYWTDIARQLGIDPETLPKLRHDYFSGDQLDAGQIDYIRTLRATGHTVALLSNDSIELTDKLQELEIANLFNPLIISAYIGVMKPEAGAYQAILKQLSISPEETVFIDDMPANIAGAKTVGIHAIHYIDGMNLPAALQPLLNMD